VGPTCQRLEREGHAGAGGGLGRAGPGAGKREKRGEMGRKRPNGQEGEILNFLNKNNL
jgi:hypothetical protein